jgi:hypothetical protein
MAGQQPNAEIAALALHSIVVRVVIRHREPTRPR